MTKLTGIQQDMLRRAVAAAVDGRTETGVAEVQRRVAWSMKTMTAVAAADRRAIGGALRQLGWVRDGFTGIGYDREPRFVAPRSAA